MKQRVVRVVNHKGQYLDFVDSSGRVHITLDPVCAWSVWEQDDSRAWGMAEHLNMVRDISSSWDPQYSDY